MYRGMPNPPLYGTPTGFSSAASIPMPESAHPFRSFETQPKPTMFSAIPDDSASTTLIWREAVHVYMCNLSR
jgi:hypothetical protein